MLGDVSEEVRSLWKWQRQTCDIVNDADDERQPLRVLSIEDQTILLEATDVDASRLVLPRGYVETRPPELRQAASASVLHDNADRWRALPYPSSNP